MIKNFNELGKDPLRKKTLEILLEGIDSVMPDKILPRLVKYSSGKLSIYEEEFDLSQGNIYIMGCGKAAGLMAYTLESIIPPEKITCGIVNSIKKFPTQKIKINEASHPIPDKKGFEGMEEILQMSKRVSPEDTVICLLSGGGSALLPDPPENITLSELQTMTELLIKSGAETYETNIVRKHVSLLKGGNLARILQPARIISLIISDDLDGREDTASRPTTYENSTFRDAIEITKKYNVFDKIPKKITNYLINGFKGKIMENPKEGDSCLDNVHNYILADNKIALESMNKKAESFGFKTYKIEKTIKGETKLSAKKIGKLLKEKYREEDSFAILCSAETIVNVKGNGAGGRVQELIAYLIDEISGQENSVAAAIGSDGVDFVPGIGGAIVDDKTYSIAKEKKINLLSFLENNNTYNLHKSLNNLILMDPTNTNVGDLFVYLQEKNHGC
ncbi:MAG: DUF4147 domain-containing protein [Candidatus Pacearchaeota archaeon]|nr:DUF4147 domain-containing protein [Candidatus Pacearchaeota archaeon]